MSFSRFSIIASSLASAFALTFALAACSPDSLVDTDPPSTIVDPDAATTAAGVTALYNGAITVFASAFGGGGEGFTPVSYVLTSGLYTDEYLDGALGDYLTDSRSSSLQFSLGDESRQAATYNSLQGARVAAFQARQALQQHGPANGNALIGRMYSLEAYTIILLAEFYCNGVPLSKTPLVGPAVLAAGSTGAELYATASALLDTAITLSADSSDFLNLARVGKGRVLLDQGKFAEAAQAVASVPLTFAYNTQYQQGLLVQVGGGGYNVANQTSTQAASTQFLSIFVTKDNEGGNGLPWSGDPRVVAMDGSALFGASPYYWLGKYPTEGSSIRLADGIEAQLIRAEASFQANPSGGEWLAILNTLRATCTSASGCAPVPNITGGTAQLPPLADSLTPAARLREILQERAYWMYATGHRQGDLRRMLRPPYNAAPYSLTEAMVYPSGTYVNETVSFWGFGSLTVSAYGHDVAAIIPRTEQKYNRKFSGCFDMNP